MSEYQYYEFVAVDRPLTATQQRELRGISTRARITASGFVNHYEWGDLKADPHRLMERYFDAFLYLANWGTRQVMLRMPIGLLDPAVAARYCGGDAASSWTAGDHVLLDLISEDEEGDGEYEGGDWEDDGEGHLASIVPARAELAAGDTRLLYLAWLLRVQGQDMDDDELEPPVPPGLASLSGPLRALVDFLRLDQDLLDVAAEASAPLTAKAEPSTAELTRWVAGLTAAEKDAALVRLLGGEDVGLRAELLRRFHGPAAGAAPSPGRTVGELLAGADQRRVERERLAAERKAAARARRQQAAAAAKEQRLDALAGKQDQAWKQVSAMIDTKKPKEYDAAVDLLRDLKTLAERDGGTPTFTGRLRRLREEHARKPSLIDRLDRAKLG